MEQKINPNKNNSSSMEFKVKPKNPGTQDLSGYYKIMADPDLRGKQENWQNSVQNAAVDTIVPGYLQETLGDIHGVVWYWKNFTVDNGVDPLSVYHIQFGFVDYYAEFWVNGKHVGSHEGGDTQFCLDVTGKLVEGNNLLAVYLINPCVKEIDGIAFERSVKSCKVAEGILPWVLYNYGGIGYAVRLLKTPQVYIEDVYVKPFWKTGEVQVEITVKNTLCKTLSGKLQLSIGEGPQGCCQQFFEGDFIFNALESTHKISISISEPRLWEIDDPNLYTLISSVEIKEKDTFIEHNERTRFGFRHFEVKDGFFYLNGKRIFLKSSHTVNQYPHGRTCGKDTDIMYKDLLFAKAAGFNAIRYINGLPYPEQLDYCDELGLMIYEQSTAGWAIGESPNMKELFEKMTIEMIMRDRNHPCVTIWGLLNETTNNNAYKNARDFLKGLRAFDDTRMVLLGSGRWDREIDVGSVSNPYSDVWEYQWGEESENTDVVPGNMVAGYVHHMGDIHIYPNMPQTNEFIDSVRTMGQGTKPIFISEYGVGSVFDTIRTLRFYEQYKVNVTSPEYIFMKRVANQFETDWKRFGLEGVYPFPEDMVVDSYKQQSRQRTHTFDVVRSNPNFCGYNLTGLLDQVFNGEGLWSYFRELKPGVMDVFQDGWSPLRWCMFVSNMNVFTGRPFTIEVVLANEDILPPGAYPVCIRISGNGKIVWEKKTTLIIPDVPQNKNPLAIQVLKEEIMLQVPAGKYTLAANIEKGGAPAGGRHDFNISVPEKPLENVTVRTWGISDEVKKILNNMGVNCTEFSAKTDGVILVGPVELPKLEDWRTLATLIARGSTVIFLSPQVFTRADKSNGWLPLKIKGNVYGFHDWLYHKETVIGAHDYFEGIDNGIVDYDLFGLCYPHYIFSEHDLPDEVASAAFVPTHYSPTGYEAGTELCSYRFGAGRFVLNAFRILETLADNPMANKLLQNIIKTEYARLPDEFVDAHDLEQMLVDIDYIGHEEDNRQIERKDETPAEKVGAVL